MLKEHKASYILDVGCGTGISTRQLIGNGFSISGCDADERMIQVAKGIQNNRHIKYYQNHVDNLPFANTSFDAVTSFSSFHWFNTKKMMNEIKRVLKRHGPFVIVNVEDINNVKHSIRRNLMPYFSPNKMYRSSKRQYFPITTLQKSQMEIAGQLHFYRTEMYSERQLCAFVKSMKVWSNISPSNHQNAMKEVIKYFKKYQTHNYLLRDVKINVIVAIKS
jgi:ubiquinone/menaquinone biosynthesis C-methylase UbiE